MVNHRKIQPLWALTKTGLKDWLLQRVSAVIIAFYFLFVAGFLISHHPLTVQDWQALFGHSWMKLLSIFVLVMILAHAWIGIWTIFTDYIHQSCLRGFLQFLVFCVFFACFVSGILIMWG